MTTNLVMIVEHDVKSIGISDHCLIHCVTSYKSQLSAQSHCTIEMRNFKNFDTDVFCWTLNNVFGHILMVLMMMICMKNVSISMQKSVINTAHLSQDE